jgi:nitric oxide reductase NorD protein
MAEPEDVITDAARHATVYARALWRRHRPAPQAPRPAPLSDVVQRLDLLVTAVFGASRPIRAAQPPAPPTFLTRVFRRGHLPRTTRAVPATDGVAIWLPADLGTSDASLASRWYRVLALQQATRAQRGSADRIGDIEDPLVRDLYLLFEADAADTALAELLPGMVASVDSLRQAALLARPAPGDFPAPRRIVEDFVRTLLARRCGEPSGLPRHATPRDSLAAARRLARRLAPEPDVVRAMGPSPLLRDWWTGALRTPPVATELLPPSAGDRHPADEPEAARSARLGRRPEVREARPDEEDERDDPGAWMIPADEPHEHAEDPLGLQRPTDRDEEAAADDYADSVSELAEARLVSTPGRAKEVLLSDDPPDARQKRQVASSGDPASSFSYPEWDFRVDAYRDPGATVRALPALQGPQQWVDQTLAAHRSMLDAIRRRFEMLRAQRSKLRKQFDGDDLDLDAYIDSYADFRAGLTLTQALYQTQRPAKRHMAIMLLVDVSGSTDGWIAANRRVIDVEREALLLVCIALEGMAEPFSVQAFSGEGPQRVSVRAVKRFDEPYSNDVARRIAALEPEHYTRAGAAIRHASALLMREPAAHRLLLLLSDGKPNDVDDYEGRYGVEDMRQAVTEARLQGIFPFCLTIDRQAANYLPHVFGASQYALLSRPELLPTVLLDWMKRLVAH